MARPDDRFWRWRWEYPWERRVWWVNLVAMFIFGWFFALGLYADGAWQIVVWIAGAISLAAIPVFAWLLFRRSEWLRKNPGNQAERVD